MSHEWFIMSLKQPFTCFNGVVELVIPKWDLLIVCVRATCLFVKVVSSHQSVYKGRTGVFYRAIK